jgi:nucleotide-binding universal stress UspA family protein
MFRTILVPLDGTRFAEAALYALRALLRRRRTRTRIRLVLVHEPAAGIVPTPELGFSLATVTTELRTAQERYLERTLSRLEPELGRAVEGRVVVGSAGRSIAAEARRTGADLVIMATHGSGLLGRAGLGSVADYVVRHLHLPILLVRPTGKPGRRRVVRFRNPLVPVDFSAASRAVFGPLRRLLRMTGGGRVTLLHVSQPAYQLAFPTMPYPMAQNAELFEIQGEAGRKRLRAMAARVRSPGVTVATRLVRGAGVATTILETLTERQYDLAVMSTHGRTGLQRLLLGGVADKVIRNSQKPVLVFRPASRARRVRRSGRSRRA